MTASIPPPIFQTGDRVVLLSDRSKVGVILADAQRVNAGYWYRLELFNKDVETVPEEDLEPFRAGLSPEELFKAGSFGDRDDFARVVTFQKLDTPLDNTLYALQGSRTEFYPHQYKPLVKFLNSEDQRLLIADEVGLGKTIEAGLIMIEQRARDALRQVLVVCPASLCPKWREEMWRRFEEEFEILDAARFRGLLSDLNERGQLGEFRYILSLQSLRQERNIDDLAAGPLPLDLLIVDEAHHCRNPSTNSFRVVLELAEASAAVLLLTATPIHLGTENLYNLFRILDPGEFESHDTFKGRLEANTPVIEAQRLALRSFPPPLEEIRERIERMGRSGYSRYFDNDLYRSVRRHVEGKEQLTREDVARLLRDLEDLNLLGHVFARSRKREVFEKPPKRTPWVRTAPMAPEEQEFYSAVTEFVRESAHDHSGTIRYFAIMSAQRQIASCMQAVKEKYASKAGMVFALGGLESTDFEEFDFFDGDGSDEEVIVSPSERVLRAAAGLGSIDTKYASLKELLDELDATEPGRKKILFSYFKGTLHYLFRRLTADGYGCELIHGDIKSAPNDPDRDERGARMRRFETSDDVQLLLSSEVSSEGLDFQFCHILINYDLPWNPMKVEQRIGRLDRLGQDSERIIIANFSVPGTIEDRILRRLYERIGIFEESIGDLEAILGEEIQKLQRDLLSRHLTPEEEERRIDQAAQVVETRKRELERLESDSSLFVGHDAYFRQELERVQQGGEFLTAEDCESFFRGYLRAFARESRLEKTNRSGVFRLSVARELEVAVRRQPDSLAKRRFFQRLGRGEVDVTFDSDTAYRDQGVEFLRLHHPLLRVAVEEYREHPEALHSVSRLRLQGGQNAARGTYFYGLYRVTITGGRERRRLEALFLPASEAEAGPLSAVESSLLLGELIRRAETLDDGEVLDPPELLERADLAFLVRTDSARREMEERNSARVQQRLTSLETTYRGRLRKKEDLLERAKRKQQAPRYIRMLEGEIRNLRSGLETRRESIAAEQDLRFSFQRVGCGLLTVEA